jgi:ankyrin repeat protein
MTIHQDRNLLTKRKAMKRSAKRIFTITQKPSPEKRIVMHTTNIENPNDYVTAIFKENGYGKDEIVQKSCSKHTSPPPQMIEAYTMEIATAVREGDLDTLKRLHDSGAALDCCNRFGEHVLHMSCRHGHVEIFKFLVDEVKVPINIVDDMQRTPLHDACWSSKLNFEIVEIIIRKAPENMLCPDKRGHTPFDYTRQSDWSKWISFLSKHRSLLTLAVQEQ